MSKVKSDPYYAKLYLNKEIDMQRKDTNNNFVEAFYPSQPNVDMEFTAPQVIPFSLVGEGVQIQFILLNESVGDIVKIGIDHK